MVLDSENSERGKNVATKVVFEQKELQELHFIKQNRLSMCDLQFAKCFRLQPANNLLLGICPIQMALEQKYRG